MATFISHNPAETEALGESWGREAKIGWVIGLEGDLGSGKTRLAGGLARGLGAAANVASPTFALVNEYRDGRLPFFHLDLYRLSSREEIIAAGLETYLIRPRGVVVVEWIDRWLGVDGVPAAGFYRQVRIRNLGETTREITHEDFGG
jgi:tRNA threonylcarbamoyladenosine biosynthesis protein TsaE